MNVPCRVVSCRLSCLSLHSTTGDGVAPTASTPFVDVPAQAGRAIVVDHRVHHSLLSPSRRCHLLRFEILYTPRPVLSSTSTGDATLAATTLSTPFPVTLSDLQQQQQQQRGGSASVPPLPLVTRIDRRASVDLGKTCKGALVLSGPTSALAGHASVNGHDAVAVVRAVSAPATCGSCSADGDADAFADVRPPPVVPRSVHGLALSALPGKKLSYGLLKRGRSASLCSTPSPLCTAATVAAQASCVPGQSDSPVEMMAGLLLPPCRDDEFDSALFAGLSSSLALEAALGTESGVGKGGGLDKPGSTGSAAAAVLDTAARGVEVVGGDGDAAGSRKRRSIVIVNGPRVSAR